MTTAALVASVKPAAASSARVSTAAGVLEAVKGFRRLKGHKEMPKLVAALRARDQQLGLVAKDAEQVA